MGILTFVFFLFSLPLHAALSSATLETIGMYHVPPGQFAMVKGLGIDSVENLWQENDTMASRRSRLDEAEREGLKVFFGTYPTPFEMLKVVPTVEEFKSHAAIAYWAIVDEPDLKKVPPDLVADIVKYIRLSDHQNRPTFVTISDLNYGPKSDDKMTIRGKAYREYLDSADIIGVLNYQTPKKLRIFLKSFVFPEIKGKRWWAIVSLNQKPKDIKKAVEYFMEGRPAGLLYYAFEDTGWNFNLINKSEIQDAVREINYTLRGWEVPKIVKAKTSAPIPSAMMPGPAIPSTVNSYQPPMPASYNNPTPSVYPTSVTAVPAPPPAAPGPNQSSNQGSSVTQSTGAPYIPPPTYYPRPRRRW